MKKLLFTLAFFITLTISFVFGQNFPPKGWMQGVYYSGNFYNSPPDHISSVRYTGDTVMCGTTYAKIFRGKTYNGGSYFSFIRKVNGKVFIRTDCTNPEGLLYNFSAKLGDTVKITGSECPFTNDTYTVDSLYNKTLLDGSLRKYFHLRTHQGGIINSIEDIGDINHGFFENCDFEGGNDHFICHKENGITLWDKTTVMAVNCDSATKFRGVAIAGISLLYINTSLLKIWPSSTPFILI